ncbi:uncharacterized protein LOC135134811 [Zophobas morio]|uniref:uncharacterized protein LOC135134811 n=1 Tax=Zophobas morio TaxID=2755281 RepID=UPI003082D3CA
MAEILDTPPEGSDYINAEMEHRHLLKFLELFYITATLQGRIAYFLMSIHAVNPSILKSFTDYNPKKYLFANMVYGVGVMLYCRPSMRAISRFNRTVFSILGSLMFNHSSLLFYGCGRVMMLHLLAYLYHVDSRYRGFHIRPYPEYESMYRQH